MSRAASFRKNRLPSASTSNTSIFKKLHTLRIYLENCECLRSLRAVIAYSKGRARFFVAHLHESHLALPLLCWSILLPSPPDLPPLPASPLPLSLSSSSATFSSFQWFVTVILYSLRLPKIVQFQLKR